MFISKRPKIPKSEKIVFFKHNFNSLKFHDLDYLENKKWEKKILNEWNVGENNSTDIMKSFYLNGVKNYSEGRNFPIKKNVSRLSPLFIGDKFPLIYYGMSLKD